MKSENSKEAIVKTKGCRYTDDELLELPLMLNSDQAAKVLGCSRSKIQAMSREGALKFQRNRSRLMYNRDYLFKILGISYESLYRTVCERRLAEEKVREQYAPLLKKYGIDIHGNKLLAGEDDKSRPLPTIPIDEDTTKETDAISSQEAQIGKLLLKALLNQD